MYRVTLNSTREAWHQIQIQDPEAGKVKLRVRYALLDTDTMAEWIAEGLSDDADGDESDSRMAALRRSLDPERRAEMDRRLADRIVDWDLGGDDGEKLPCTTDNKLAVLKIPYLREPIDRGLFDASRGAARKN